MKEVGGRRRSQILDDLRIGRYWELKEEAEDIKSWVRQLSHKHKEEIQVTFHKCMDLSTINIIIIVIVIIIIINNIIKSMFKLSVNV